ncbi:MAG: ATP-binding protein, partial [Planctomycetota bacterium]
SMLACCLERIATLMDWQVGQAWAVDERAALLYCLPNAYHSALDVSGFRAESLELRFAKGKGLPGRVWESLAPVWLSDPPQDANFPRSVTARACGLRAAFAFPIERGGRLLAILEFFTRELREPSAEFLGGVAKLGSHLAIVFERRKAEEARSRLAAYCEASPDVIASADPDGRLNYMNAAGRRILGIGADEDVSQLTIEDLYTPADYRTVREEIIPAAIRDGCWRGDLPLRARDGTPVPISHVIVAHRSKGVVEFLACVGHDLSHERQLEEEMRQAQKMEAAGRLAAGMAHDFNNFLTVIVCSATIAAQRPADEVTRRELDAILGASAGAAGLTQQLLAFSRRQHLAPRVIDLNALLERIEPMVRRVVGEDVTVSVALAEKLGNVRADPGQLEQVVMNLAVNARDAMPKGGRLAIETRVVPRPPHDDPHAELAVVDTGSGMDAATRSRVFEPFFTTKEPGKGTGLGLSTVYGIVVQSGGEIAVESEPGRGTTFRIQLPVVDAPLDRPVTPLQPVLVRRGSETILVVEDERGVRRSLRLLLEQEGYRVLEAQDGVEALEVGKRHQGPIHVLFTDVIMPRMSAPELVAHFTRLRPDTAVLYTSGHLDRAGQGLDMAAGAQFIAKPFTLDALRRKLRAVLGD